MSEQETSAVPSGTPVSKPPHSIVLGAGVVGVSIAWHLRQRGHQVTLIDRRRPGRETSFGNAGIMQCEAVRPYAFPRDLTTLLSVLPNRRVDIRYRPMGMLRAASPLLRYWQNSAPAPYARIVNEYAPLILRCLQAHAVMIKDAGAEHLIQQGGYLELFRTQAALNAKHRIAEDVHQRFGVSYRLLDAAEVARQEPALSNEIMGAIHWQDPWTASDPGALVAAYGDAFERHGGALLEETLTAIEPIGDRWQVSTCQNVHEADHLVMALGPWSDRWLKPLGYHFPSFVKRGYHMHYAYADTSARLKHWVMDAESGYLLAPMAAGIRLTTGAELDDLDAPAHEGQWLAAEKVARRLFPLGERCDASTWKGARPCTPDMKPIIGPAPRHQGLWLAFGHGHHGFTLGPATGALLADLIESSPAPIDMAPFAPSRFNA